MVWQFSFLYALLDGHAINRRTCLNQRLVTFRCRTFGWGYPCCLLFPFVLAFSKEIPISQFQAFV